MKFDPNTGDTLFFKRYEEPGYQAPYGCKEFSNGDLLIYADDQEDVNGPFLIKTNASGDTIWENRYGSLGEQSSPTAIIDSADFIYIGNGYNFCGEFGGYRIRQIDSSGSVVQTWISPTDCVVNIVKSKFSGYIGVTSNVIDIYYDAYIGKINDDLNFEWKYYGNFDSVEYGDLIDFFIAGIIELPDSSIVMAGIFLSEKITKTQGFITKLSPSGEIIWERPYYTKKGADSRLNSIVRSDDNGFILGGVGFSDDIHKYQDFWVLKLDSMGCLIPGCDTLSNAVIELSMQNDPIIIYPNPVYTSAWVQLTVNEISNLITPVVEISDMSGRVIKTIAIPDFSINGNKVSFTFSRDNIENGIYLLTIKNTKGIFGVQKIIFQ